MSTVFANRDAVVAISFSTLGVTGTESRLGCLRGQEVETEYKRFFNNLGFENREAEGKGVRVECETEVELCVWFFTISWTTGAWPERNSSDRSTHVALAPSPTVLST